MDGKVKFRPGNIYASLCYFKSTSLHCVPFGQNKSCLVLETQFHFKGMLSEAPKEKPLQDLAPIGPAELVMAGT